MTEPAGRRWPRTLVAVGLAVAAVAVPPTVVGVTRAKAYLSSLYEPPRDTTAPVTAPPYDPAKPTVVVLLGNEGAHVGDVLGPHETFAATGAFNVYTVAPERKLVTLLGGLDLVPDFSFAELDARLAGAAPQVVAVPQLPDAAPAARERLNAWLVRQAGNGALVLGVCIGAEVVASAGLLAGRDATSHWFRLGKLEQRYPEVRWLRATRYVDDGDVITTGGVLSGIDGALRVIERRLGTAAATGAANAVGWTHYSPGTPAPLPRSSFGPRDTIAGVNLTFRPRPTIGVVVTDGIGEIELASIFATYTEAAYAARTVTLGAGSTAPVRTRHGLVFVPRGDAFAVSVDRLLVPGAAAHRLQGLDAEYPHAQPGFAFDLALRDMARTIDVPTARWRAKTLEYPLSDPDLTGAGWPWLPTLLPFLYALLIVALAIVALRRRNTVRSRP
ncbi:DJ-1/PfpI family protein [Asanoa iriomotensis]|uniref:Transcriptional regulator n=1 Tax=Asanoa iriomotensis TaxID=234613 RepID=A0ABQ4C5A9_9ACTN|nr:DJ-1/PfpI family protein [Asanoa iriomotensis]GIF57972.1 transcriptional regulator [Asanoa iriomotensis]